MHVGIDGMRLEGQRLGVGRYIEYLLRYWDRDAPPGDHFSLFTRRPFDLGAVDLSNRVQNVVLPSRLGGYPWQTLVMGPAARSGCDVLFGPSYRLPYFYRGPAVVAIHSVNEVQAGAHDRRYRYTHGLVNRRSARIADRVVVVTGAVRRDIAAAYGTDDDRIDVVVQGADESFRPMPPDSPEIRAVRERYLDDPDQPYVLWVGKLSQRRNIPLLIEAFAELKHRHGLPHKLLLFGPNHLGLPLARLAAEAGVGDAVIQDDGVVATHRDLVPVYCGADLYANASSYEGFSMTMVEAFSCGVPVVAVGRGAIDEIARGAAVLIDEPTPGALADAMARVLTDAALQQELRGASLERAERFRWDRTASETLEVLRRVVVDRSGA